MSENTTPKEPADREPADRLNEKLDALLEKARQGEAAAIEELRREQEAVLDEFLQNEE